MSEEVKMYKPEFEMFYGKRYKGYCGNCGRMLYTAGFYEATMKQMKTCPLCGQAIDWGEDNGKE